MDGIRISAGSTSVQAAASMMKPIEGSHAEEAKESVLTKSRELQQAARPTAPAAVSLDGKGGVVNALA